MQIKELEKLLRKELNIEIGKKMNRKLGRINDREFEKGMWFQQRLFNIAIEHIENKLKIKIYEVTTPHSPHE